MDRLVHHANTPHAWDHNVPDVIQTTTLSWSEVTCSICVALHNQGPTRAFRTTKHDAGDSVNHPDHYNAHPSGVECIEIVRHHSFNVGNVIKYLWRDGLKDTTVELEDLKKAAFYLNDEINARSGADGQS
jgi:hypothetical protein